MKKTTTAVAVPAPAAVAAIAVPAAIRQKRKFPAIFGKGLEGYQVAVFFCKISELRQIVKVCQFDTKVGISMEQPGYQRGRNKDRIKRMSEALDIICQSHRMFDMGAFRLFADNGSVTPGDGQITINAVLNLIDGQHRIGVAETVLTTDKFLSASDKLADLDVVVTVLIPPAEREHVALRDQHQIFDFANKAVNLTNSQVVAMMAVETLNALGEGVEVSGADLTTAIIAKTWDRMTKRQGWLWTNRIDIVGTVSGEQRSSVGSFTITLSEMLRTTKEVMALVRPEMISEGPQLDIFQQNTDILYTVLSKFWYAIGQRQPDLCKISNHRRFKLMSPQGAKALNAVLAAYLRYSVIDAQPKFIKQYGTLTCADAVEDGAGTPLADLLDTVGSYLRNHQDAVDFWAVGGPWNHGSSYDGIKELAEQLWMAMKQKNYGSDTWREFCSAHAGRIARRDKAVVAVEQ